MSYEGNYMATAKLLSKRKNRRLKVEGGITLTPVGMGQVIDLNENGIAFACVDERHFPGEWSMAIYDCTGLSLEELQVKKVWEKHVTPPGAPATFPMVVGGTFTNLSSSQKNQLNSYLQYLRKGVE
jgi:hypothetical protein